MAGPLRKSWQLVDRRLQVKQPGMRVSSQRPFHGRMPGETMHHLCDGAGTSRTPQTFWKFYFSEEYRLGGDKSPFDRLFPQDLNHTPFSTAGTLGK